MRIEWTPQLKTAKTRRDGRGAGTEGGFSSQVSGETAPQQPTAPATLTPVEGLFALQEVPDASAGRRRAVARGNELLDQLDALRLALLAGTVPRQQLRQLAQLSRERLQQIGDPRLAALVEEIELRAAVELAKLGEDL
jgi:hypothetical protein